MYRGKKNTKILVTCVNVGASREFSCGFITSLTVLNVSCFSREDKKISLLEQ